VPLSGYTPVMRPHGLVADVAAARRQAEAMRRTQHRTRMPAGAWVMGQTWERLLFAHWRVPVHAVQRVVPPQLPVDVIDGDAWVAVTPFGVRALRLRGMPPLPLVSSFPELNVRTYVTVDGVPGIHFFSLDAASALAVLGARRLYRLPYFRAEMTSERSGEDVVVTSRRVARDGPSAAFRVRYRASGAPSLPAAPGTLEHFLTERYSLYTLGASGEVLRGDIHHPPWTIQPAEGVVEENTVTAGLHIPLSGEPMLHFAPRQDVVFWPLRPVGRRA
jgi:uncharacterized protein